MRSPIRALRCGCLLLALVCGSSPLHAQDVSTILYVGAGPVSASLGVRLEVVSVWGAYARMAVSGVANICEDSLPPRCNYPEGAAREYALGMTHNFDQGTWRGFFAAGGGVLSWQNELDPFLDLTMDFRRSLTQRTSFLLGIQGVVAPGVDRGRNGSNAIVSKKTVVFVNAILGLVVRLW